MSKKRVMNFRSYQMLCFYWSHRHSHSNDHASVVAAAMAESALRKRDLNGNSENIPETLGNVLVPPQLKGRL
ncbi:unnamed protein product [Arabis nemorensis]|uniref:Uncharacterized protein n=1 Tax=Arabis nemorensis TaxID=586526 RepID=A0A565ATQ9_9BRAS|nr:unnamed protein product [Arabis nemorensis]